MTESIVFSEISKALTESYFDVSTDDSEGFNELVIADTRTGYSINVCVEDGVIEYCQFDDSGEALEMSSVETSDEMIKIIKGTA